MDKDDNTYIASEILDLKAMLEMQQIINQEQEDKLKKSAEEKSNFINERLSYINKLSKLQEDFDKSVSTVKALKQKINQLEAELDVEKKEADDEREKVMWLTKDNQNLLHSLEKNRREIKKLSYQLDDERTFYAQEKARYCKEMKRKKNHSAEVQTDNSLEEDSVCSKCGSYEGKEVLRLKSLYKHQLITTCLICEKYIKLQNYKTALANRLVQTRKEYKAAMCEVMLEFDKCRNEYTTLLEDKCLDCNAENMLKIVNRSNRLASDNALLKQELMYLNDRLRLVKKYFSEEGTPESHSNRNVSLRNTPPLRKRLQRRVKIKQKIDSNLNSENINSSTSVPESTENEHLSTPQPSTNSKRIKKRSCRKFAKRRRRYMANYNSGSGMSRATCSENSDNSDKSFKNSNTTNQYSSFISLNSENANLKQPPNCSSTKDSQTARLEIDTESKSNEPYVNSEPACIDVTCDEVKPYVKDGVIVQTPVKSRDEFKSDLQAWLARTPVIECSEWSKSVQGIDIMKTESAPEILAFRPLSILSLKQI